MKNMYCIFSGKVIFALILAISLLDGANAQIITRGIPSGSLEKYGVKELIATDQLPTFRLPDVDLNALLKEDSTNNLLGKPFITALG